ncbi:uncharacterized protein LOC132261652 [Phlebotomus argentipes]|uniref:uncharacterized protein LOC132261652 n=1 Tax=Phlebotomus argentipes TaxID=94469 RepID=UPI0028935104|nr:uncharacterized protein LOC132261652 [Phlebotomus argentipes]
MAPLKLYHFPVSPPSRVAFLIVKYLKIDAEIVIVDLLNKGQLAPDFVKINPQHTVPTIDDNGFILWESRAIATYLVSSKAPGNSLYPTDVKKRAVVDARLFLDQALQLAATEVMYPIHMGATTIPEDKKEKVYKILGHFNTFLEGKQFAGGNDLTVADLALLATISSLNAIGANIKKFKNISAWYKKLESVPGFQENEEQSKNLGMYIKSKVQMTGTWDDSLEAERLFWCNIKHFGKMAPLKLYHFSASPPSRFALLTIRNLKLDVDIVVINTLNKEQFAPEFVKTNPQHTVPTIDDNGFILWESRAIATYLVSNKTPGSSLYPTDVKKRAVVDARLFLDHELQMAFLEMLYPIYRLGETEILKAQKVKMYKVLGNLNTFLEGQKYVAGSELTLADLALLVTVISIQEVGANIKKFNNITAWLKTLESVPGAQENLEGAQFFGNFIKSKIDWKQNWED